MTPTPHDEPLAEVGREPLHEAIADAREERRGGISIQTLGVASVASAAASFTASHLWGPGTVASAALTPIVVALVSEFLRRPVNRVSATVAPIVARPPTPAGRPQYPPAPAGRDNPPARSQPDPPRQAWRPRWGLILLTGLLAFAIVVGVYTVPDLLVGHSITGAGGATTFFSGGGSSPAPTTTVTTTVPTQTETQTVQVQTVTTTVPSTTPAAPPATTTTPTTPGTPGAAPDQQLTTTTTTPTTPTAPLTTPTTPTP